MQRNTATSASTIVKPREQKSTAFDSNRRRSMYDEKRGDLSIKIGALRNFRAPSGFEITDLQVITKVTVQEVPSGNPQKTKPKTGPDLAPTFMESFKFNCGHIDGVAADISVVGKLTKVNTNESAQYTLGSCHYPLKVLELDGRPNWIYCHQQPTGSNGKADNRRSKIVTGEVQITATFDYNLKKGQIGDADKEVLKEDAGIVNNALASKERIIKKRIWDRKVELGDLEKKIKGLSESDAKASKVTIENIRKEVEYLEERLGQKVLEDPAKVDMRKQELASVGAKPRQQKDNGQTRAQSMRQRASTYRESMKSGTNIYGEVSPIMAAMPSIPQGSQPRKQQAQAPSVVTVDVKEQVASAVAEALLPVMSRLESLTEKVSSINLTGGRGAAPSKATGNADADARIAKLEAEIQKRDAVILKKDLLLKKTLLSMGDDASSSVMQELSNFEANRGMDIFDDLEEKELKATKEKLMKNLSETNQKFSALRKANLKNEISNIQTTAGGMSAPPPPGAGGPPPPPPPPGAPGAPPRRDVMGLLSFPKGGAAGGGNMDMDSVLSKLEQLDKLDSILTKLNDINLSGGGGGRASAPARSLDVIQNEMKVQLEIIMNDSASDKDKECANIQYELLITEMEKSPDFIAEQKKKRKEKEEKEKPLNKAAYDKLKTSFTADKLANEETRKRVRRNPELILISMDTKHILLRHANDFKSFVLNGLGSEELRALYYNLPEFKRDQQIQADFKERCFKKIDEQIAKEEEMRKNPPKKKVAKKLNFKVVEGDMVEELKKLHNKGK